MTCPNCSQDAIPLPDRGSLTECLHCGQRYVGTDFGFYSYSAMVFTPEPEDDDTRWFGTNIRRTWRDLTR